MTAPAPATDEYIENLSRHRRTEISYEAALRLVARIDALKAENRELRIGIGKAEKNSGKKKELKRNLDRSRKAYADLQARLDAVRAFAGRDEEGICRLCSYKNGHNEGGEQDEIACIAPDILAILDQPKDVNHAE